MISSDNSFTKLDEVIVGRELELNKRTIDFTFKHFYKTNLNHSVYEQEDYSITTDLIQKRIYDLDNLQNILEAEGIKVYRPDIVDKVHQIKTPQFTSELSSASNVRDLSLIMDNKIIETPTYVLNRYFENMSLYGIFDKIYKGGQWIHPPHTIITSDTIDLDDWTNKRDYTRDMSKYTMAIDGAQFLRMHERVIVNISSYNHYLGYLWVKSFFPNKDFHIVSIVDNHIDGAIVQLNANTFLVNPKIKKELLKQMPDWFSKYKFIEPDFYEARDVSNKINLDGQLSSSLGMDINVLSIDNKTVLVNKEARGTISALEREQFTVIPVELDNCEIFGGGIHCSTLDTLRN